MVSRILQAKTDQDLACEVWALHKNGGTSQVYEEKTAPALKPHNLVSPSLKALQENLHQGPKLAIASFVICRAQAGQAGVTENQEHRASGSPVGGWHQSGQGARITPTPEPHNSFSDSL